MLCYHNLTEGQRIKPAVAPRKGILRGERYPQHLNGTACQPSSCSRGKPGVARHQHGNGISSSRGATKSCAGGRRAAIDRMLS